jgi:hypothetical protein
MTQAAAASPAIRPTSLGGIASTLGWGAYCACSWTWCIGMFLPIILLGRFGWAGFWAFAIPNLIGCVAFGYVFTPERSRRFANAHVRPIRWFSLATIAFQIFFIGWSTGSFVFTPQLAGDPDPTGAGAAADLLAWPVLGAILTWTAGAAALSARGDLFWRWLATLIAGASGVLFAITFQKVGGFPIVATPMSTAPVLGIVPLMALGFLACPVLDATFHRARQQSPSRHSFAVFGIVFAMMLAFAATSFDPGNPTSVIPIVMPVIVAQWTLQLLFTIGAHLRELTTLPEGRLGRNLPILAAIAIGTLLGMPGIAGENVYLMLLGLYAIPFPMYVIASTIRGFDRPLPFRWILAILLVSLAASPLGWLGFIENRTWFLLPAAALTAIAGWAIGRLARSSPPVQT